MTDQATYENYVEAGFNDDKTKSKQQPRFRPTDAARPGITDVGASSEFCRITQTEELRIKIRKVIIVRSIMGIIIGLLVWATTGELVWGEVCGMMCAALKTDDKYIFKLRSVNGSLVTIATTRRILAKVIQWTVGAGAGAGVGAAVGAAVGTL